ncbi:MAG: hypothetical protein U1E12_05785 [Hydrogenophaga sp.]|uniref:hypothetical protein n=1 Tax=Hydrogenophaga sp. TaxID=1904254 RepID=UPI002AB9933E|nr:hypothetical protein [Hydrogenophaga sp.]MDZ4101172.1 hypothetical protein [Hydrogenophaga sp.]
MKPMAVRCSRKWLRNKSPLGQDAGLRETRIECLKSWVFRVTEQANFISVFAIHKDPCVLKIISAALAALTLVASPGHAQVAVGAAALKPAANTTVDWTPMFKSWERGCEFSSELSSLIKGMQERRVVLPPAYRAAAGKISKRKDQGYDFTLLPIQGTYHGLAVAAFEFYSMPETDDSGVSLILSASKQDVKKVLSRVKYSKVTNDIGDEKQAQVVLEGKYAAVLCF